MKRTHKHLEEHESKLSKLLFNKTEAFISKLKDTADEELDPNPVWNDEDDEKFRANIIPHTNSTDLYSSKLKQKFETLIGTPKWAKITKTFKSEDGNHDSEEVLRKVGHLQKAKHSGLKKGLLEFKKFPTINKETSNEGPIISCVEFHPKINATLIAGEGGVVSLFSIGGDVNNKLHSFKLKNWKINAAHFNQDGSKAYISSRSNHNFCIYDVARATPTVHQLPHVIKRPYIFELSKDNKYIASSDCLDEVYIICADSIELLKCLKHNNNVQMVAFSADSTMLYSMCEQGEIIIWDLSTYRVVKKFYDQGCVRASTITTSPCGKLLSTGSSEGIVNIYDLNAITTYEPTPLKSVSNLTTKITCLKFNATSEILAISSSFYPNSVKLVHLPSYHVFSNFPDPNTNIQQAETVSFSPNSGFMALSNNKSKAFLYRLKHYKNY